MRTVQTADILISGDRQRKEGKDSKSIATLKKSILEKGLFHPIVLAQNREDPSKFHLIAGERRLSSIKELHTDGFPIRYEAEEIPNGSTPYTLLSELDHIGLKEAELDENVLRLQLTWPEECAARVALHALRKELNPEQTQLDTAKEIAAVTNLTPEAERKNLMKMQAVMAHIGAPSVRKAKTLNSAYRQVLDRDRAELEAELVRVNNSMNGAAKNPFTVLEGNFLELYQSLDPTFDVIICDPPYGINIHHQQFEQRHEYDDSPDTAQALCREILRRGFHLLKPQGHLFMFCDIDHFLTIRTWAEQQAFSTWRTPIIWDKGVEGHAPWGKNGFSRSFELILMCVKGQRNLVMNPGRDVKQIRKPTHEDRLHAAEKPAELLKWLLEISTRPGDNILDPCCGSGPIFAAARGMGTTVTGIELNSDYAKKALARTLGAEDAKVETQVKRKMTLGDIEAKIGIRRI